MLPINVISELYLLLLIALGMFPILPVYLGILIFFGGIGSLFYFSWKNGKALSWLFLSYITVLFLSIISGLLSPLHWLLPSDLMFLIVLIVIGLLATVFTKQGFIEKEYKKSLDTVHASSILLLLCISYLCKILITNSYATGIIYKISELIATALGFTHYGLPHFGLPLFLAIIVYNIVRYGITYSFDEGVQPKVRQRRIYTLHLLVSIFLLVEYLPIIKKVMFN